MAALRKVVCFRAGNVYRSCAAQFANQFSSSTGSSELTSKSVTAEDKMTHTGQCWESDDPRMVRFIDKTKQVNEHFAIELINAIPPKIVKERVTWCDGGGGALGHPRVYINLIEDVLDESVELILLSGREVWSYQRIAEHFNACHPRRTAVFHKTVGKLVQKLKDTGIVC